MYVKREIFELKYKLLLLMLIVLLFDYNFFVKYVVFNIGTNWRVNDVFVTGIFLLVLPILLIKPALGMKWGIFSLNIPKNIQFFLFAYCFVLIISLLRGILGSGSKAIAISREYILGFLLLLSLPEIIRTEEKVYKLYKMLIILLVPIWLINFLYKGIASIGSVHFLAASTALSLSTAMIFALSFYIHAKDNLKKSKAKLLRYSLPVIILVGLVMTFYARHRSVWLGTFAALAVLIFIEFRENKRFGKMISIISIIIISIVVFISVMQTVKPDIIEFLFYNRLAFLTRGMEFDPSGYWRYQSWHKAIRYIWDVSPWWGVGFNFNSFYFVKTEEGMVPIHNDYIYFFQAAGVLGLFVFIGFLLMVLLYGLKKIKQIVNPVRKGILIGAVASLTMHLVYMFFYASIILLWIIIILIFYIPYFEKREKLKIKQNN